MNGLLPAVNKILRNNPAANITSMTICRKPISPMTMKLVESLGNTNKTKIYYHLFLLIHLDNGKTFQTEKNPLINLRKKNVKTKQRIEISALPEGMTMIQLLEKSKQLLGNKFLPYHASNNNCQTYILSLVKASGALNAQHQQFIQQETTDLFHGKPLVRKFSNAIISAYSKAKGGDIEAASKSKNVNPWLKFVKELREKYPNLSYKEVLIKAKGDYKK